MLGHQTTPPFSVMEFYIKDLESHESDLKRIQAEVRDLSQRKQAFRIFHGSTNSTRPAHHERVVDISCLRRILRIDPKKETALVEPNVPMDKLVEATLEVGLVPPVVTEFPGITVGGGFAGSAGESSSFKYGYFSQTVSRVEMILADGVIVRASAHERGDLFHGAAGAAGTLGVITLLELRLISAKTYVKLTYYPISSMGDAVDSIMGETKNSMHDYVDGILYSRNSGVIMAGILTNDKPSSVGVQRFRGPWDPWFYMHAQEQIQNRPEEAGGEAMVELHTPERLPISLRPGRLLGRPRVLQVLRFRSVQLADPMVSRRLPARADFVPVAARHQQLGRLYDPGPLAALRER